MAKIKDVVFYLISHYPSDKKGDLSQSRLTKMVYLADWHQSINFDEQVTDIQWYFDEYGPFVRDIDDVITKNPDVFEKKIISNIFEAPKILYSLKKDVNYEVYISSNEKKSLDHVIKQTEDLNFDDFIGLIYATFPVLTSNKNSRVNLKNKSHEYKEFNQKIDMLRAS